MLLNNPWVKEEIKGEKKKPYEINENGKTTHQNLWDAARAVLRGEFAVINAYLKKQKNFKH